MADSDSNRRKLLTRAEAKALHLARYFPGSRCPRGHVVERTTSDGQCTECCRLKMRARREIIKASAASAAEVKFKAEVEHAVALRGKSAEQLHGIIVDRRVAKAAGLIYYFNGNPCVRGHIALRQVSSGTCIVCAGAHARARRLRNVEYDRKKRREWKEKNPTYRADYKKEHPELHRAVRSRAEANRRTRKRDGSTSSEVAAWLSAQRMVCYWCGKKCDTKYHIDHYMPLSKGGRHEISNLVIACPTCNLQKNAKDPIEFARSCGRLF